MRSFNPEISEQDFKILRDYIEEICGISLRMDKSYLVQSRFARILAEEGCTDFRTFCQKVKEDPSGRLRVKIIDAITTKETSWFRDRHPFTVLGEKILPEFMDSIQQEKVRRVRIWSAGCSTGQEPYSIAMVAQELSRRYVKAERLLQHLDIVATDISPAALYMAQRGNYDVISMSRGLEDYHRQKYFVQERNTWQVSENLRRMVTFRQHDLQLPLQPLGRFHLIFFRNVSIYFSERLKKELYRRMAETLYPGGYLFIGVSELLTGYSDDFHRLTHQGSCYYKIKELRGRE